MPDSTLPADLGRTLSQLTARVERMERRTVPNDISNWVKLTSGILVDSVAAGTFTVTFPVLFTMMPLDTYGARCIDTPTTPPTWSMCVQSYTTSGSRYTGATFTYSIFQTSGKRTLLEWYLGGPIG